MFALSMQNIEQPRDLARASVWTNLNVSKC